MVSFSVKCWQLFSKTSLGLGDSGFKRSSPPDSERRPRSLSPEPQTCADGAPSPDKFPKPSESCLPPSVCKMKVTVQTSWSWLNKVTCRKRPAQWTDSRFPLVYTTGRFPPENTEVDELVITKPWEFVEHRSSPDSCRLITQSTN